MTLPYHQQVGHGPDVVLLHGWAAHSGVWHDIVPQLATQYRIHLIDIPGFGRSAMPSGPYELSTLVDALLEVAPASAAWVGWSLGGLLATAVALRAPERVTKLITVASSPCFVSQLVWMGMAPQVLARFATQLQSDFAGTLRRFIALQFHGLEVDKQRLRQLEAQLLTPEPSLQALQGGLRILEQVDLRDQLMQIKCPMVGMYGRLDNIVPVSVAEQIKTCRPDIHTIVFEQAAHIPFLTHPEPFLAQLRQVL